jgi:Tetratricopeptide repeat
MYCMVCVFNCCTWHYVVLLCTIPVLPSTNTQTTNTTNMNTNTKNKVSRIMTMTNSCQIRSHMRPPIVLSHQPALHAKRKAVFRYDSLPGSSSLEPRCLWATPPVVAPTLKSIGTILTKKGDYDSRIKYTVLHGTAGYPDVANAYSEYMLLGTIHYKKGELADAKRQYRHALNTYRRNKGEDHPETVGSRRSIEPIR